MKWNFVDSKKSGELFGHYEYKGWKVYSIGIAWKVAKPDGYIYSAEFKTLEKAKEYAEERCK